MRIWVAKNLLWDLGKFLWNLAKIFGKYLAAYLKIWRRQNKAEKLWYLCNKSRILSISAKNLPKSQSKFCMGIHSNGKFLTAWHPHITFQPLSLLKENKLTKTVTLPSEHHLVYQWNSCMICLLEPPPTWKRECQSMVICGTPFKMFFKNKFQNPITFFWAIHNNHQQVVDFICK